jgi:hypothetical protein
MQPQPPLSHPKPLVLHCPIVAGSPPTLLCGTTTRHVTVRQGVNYFAPNINVLRDPRWGRGYETAGEDALVNGRFAVQYVGGLQGHNRYMKAVATCKHSLLYDLEQRRETNSLHATARDITEYFIVPFEFCIKRAKVASIMCQYEFCFPSPFGCQGRILGVQHLFQRTVPDARCHALLRHWGQHGMRC